MRPRTAMLLVGFVLGSTACQSENIAAPQPEFATAALASYDFLNAGIYHSCISRNSVRMCWGVNGDGQLGIGRISTLSTTAQPVVNGTGDTFGVGDGGYNHTCSLSGTRAYCWGFNGYGQLGNGTTTPSSSPVLVSGGISWQWIAAGGHFTCGISTIKVAYCWGYNGAGQLGNGTKNNQSIPTAVNTALRFDKLVLGEHFVCAWLNPSTATGSSVYCWGANDFGQLANGSVGGIRTSPGPAVTGKWLNVTAGSFFACASKGGSPSYLTYCWGSNAYKQIGYQQFIICSCDNPPPGDTYLYATSPLPVDGGLHLNPIAAGYGHVCGRQIETGAMYCWGRGDQGQLGNGSTYNTIRASPVAGGYTYQEKLAAGGYHTMAVRSDGSVLAWGRNVEGQLGNGTQNGSPVPIVVNP